MPATNELDREGENAKDLQVAGACYSTIFGFGNRSSQVSVRRACESVCGKMLASRPQIRRSDAATSRRTRDVQKWGGKNKHRTNLVLRTLVSRSSGRCPANAPSVCKKQAGAAHGRIQIRSAQDPGFCKRLDSLA